MSWYWIALLSLAYFVAGCALIPTLGHRYLELPSFDDAAEDTLNAGFLILFALMWPVFVGFGVVGAAMWGPARGLQALIRSIGAWKRDETSHP